MEKQFIQDYKNGNFNPNKIIKYFLNKTNRRTGEPMKDDSKRAQLAKLRAELKKIQPDDVRLDKLTLPKQLPPQVPRPICPPKRYHQEPFLQKTLEEYPKKFDANKIIKYFQTKKNMRTGKPLSLSSQISQLSTFKKQLREISPLPKLDKLTIGSTLKKTSNPEKKIIPNSNDVVHAILKGLGSDNFDDLYPALLLATGLSPNDLYTISIQDIDNIKTLKPQNTIKKSLKRFQSLFPEIKECEMTQDEITREYGNQNAEALVNLSKILKLKIRAIDLKKIYLMKQYKDSNSPLSFKKWANENIGKYIPAHYENIVLK
jgi:integrase